MMEVKEHTKFYTPYPNIVKIEGVCGGEAIIDNTRIAVWHIVEYYYKVGMSVEEILADWDYLTPAQVFSALAYHHDNREEIDHLRQINSYEHWQQNFQYAGTAERRPGGNRFGRIGGIL